MGALQFKFLQHEGDIDWQDVFAIWRAYEAHQSLWKDHWQERGFDSWEDWRKSYAKPIQPENLQWGVYRIIEPNMAAKDFYGTPTRGWQAKCYDGNVTEKIKNILDHPIIKNNQKIIEIVDNFPYQTMLTGIVNKGRIVLIEGMHRACALAQLEKVKGDVVIALANFEGEIPLLGTGDKNVQ
ncbi:MAG TPA: hypothetical protein GX706_01315 [Candidatus Moranbacteria bacterium]|nr:hypothetical protein [Candidatus Moranbacteria bacterium]